MQDTIFALSTPPGRSAIAVVRISGTEASHALHALTSPLPEPRRASLRKLRDPVTSDLLDEALVLLLAKPRTETGEDIVELHLHGGKAVVAAVLDVLAEMPGLRPAEPGEFARRALANGKLDLAQLEGLADLIEAETDAQRVQALRGASGVASRVYKDWRDATLATLALVSAAIDFSDEGDVAADAVHAAEKQARYLAAALATALASGHRGEIVREGYRVVLAGPPNAGKSSLLNALARRDAAIVSEEAGTTRDVIEIRLDLGGYAVVVSDTAGLRETVSKIEQEGIRRTLAAASRADLVLWLVEPGGPARPPADLSRPGTDVISVETKSDILTPPGVIHVKQDGFDGPLRVSAVTGDGIAALVEMLSRRAKDAAGRPEEALITRLRHRREIETAHRHVQAFLDEPTQDIELRAESLRFAASAIGRITGQIGAEEVLGEIFSRFCIGK